MNSLRNQKSTKQFPWKLKGCHNIFEFITVCFVNFEELFVSLLQLTLHEQWNFPLRIFSVKVTEFIFVQYKVKSNHNRWMCRIYSKLIINTYKMAPICNASKLLQRPFHQRFYDVFKGHSNGRSIHTFFATLHIDVTLMSLLLTLDTFNAFT